VVLGLTVLEGINLAGAFLGFAAVGLLIWFASRGDPEREAEEAARLHYDRTGSWPDDQR
jgi:hypothetical protein